MWAQLIYLLPAASILSTYTVEEDAYLDGKLEEELPKLIKKHITPNKLILRMEPKLHARVDLVFPKSTNLWNIVDSIIHRYHLAVLIETNSQGAVVMTLKQGAAWNT